MALHRYQNAKGSRVPGVTTVIGQNLGWGKEALMWWANQMGLEGKSHREVAEKAADAGTLAHAMVEAELKGRPAPITADIPQDVVEKAETAYLAWLEWARGMEFKLLQSEVSLVSELHQFGGTIDIAAIQNVPCILDIKTSNGIYPEHKIQIAAYGRLYSENYPTEKIGAYYILRLDKTSGGFGYQYWPELNDAWEAFTCLLRLHQLKDKLK